MTSAEETLIEMLRVAGLAKRPSYARRDVCLLLGVSEMQFFRMTEAYCPDPETGEPIRPDTLDSFLLRSNRRVTYPELVKFLERNNLYLRKHG